MAIRLKELEGLPMAPVLVVAKAGGATRLLQQAAAVVVALVVLADMVALVVTTKHILAVRAALLMMVTGAGRLVVALVLPAMGLLLAETAVQVAVRFVLGRWAL